MKFWGDVKFGIHSVCVLAEKLDKGAQYYANVALKFNLKCGGVNQLLPKQLGFLNNEDTMVVGIDVTHPAPKVRTCLRLCFRFGVGTPFPTFNQ